MNTYLQQIQSISLPNKYTRWYCQIVNRAQLRATTRKEAKALFGYFEKHHILPKSFKLGGEKDKENYAFLTSQEHFICHLLLIRMSVDSNKSKMIHAAWEMVNRKTATMHRYKTTSRTYEILRKSAAVESSNALKGVSKSETHKQNMRNSFTPERLAKLADCSKNRIWTDEAREKCGNSNRGKVLSKEEIKNRITNLNTEAARKKYLDAMIARKGKTYEEIYGVEQAAIMRQKRREQMIGNSHAKRRSE